jgi:hypothetical protein
MRISKGTYKDWEAVYCYSGDCALVVGISKGPRILSFTNADGPNLLYEDHTGFRVGDWYLYGGHRFAIAPESDRSYYPDNEPCEAFEQHGTLHVQAPRTAEGVQKTLSITPAVSGRGFDISHVLTNVGTDPWQGALWAITCIPPQGSVTAHTDADDVHIWPGTKPGVWEVDGSRIVAYPDGSRGKIGWYSGNTEITSVTPDRRFSIRVPEVTPRSKCVDGGSNVELFYCREHYELETLSGEVVLAPGESVSHVQQWRI